MDNFLLSGCKGLSVYGKRGRKMRKYGYKCGNEIIFELGGHDISLTIDEELKTFVSISKYNRPNASMCEEVIVDVDEVYSTKEYPNRYFTIYKVTFGDIVKYVLEEHDGNGALRGFMICDIPEQCDEAMEEI